MLSLSNFLITVMGRGATFEDTRRVSNEVVCSPAWVLQNIMPQPLSAIMLVVMCCGNVHSSQREVGLQDIVQLVFHVPWLGTPWQANDTALPSSAVLTGSIAPENYDIDQKYVRFKFCSPFITSAHQCVICQMERINFRSSRRRDDGLKISRDTMDNNSDVRFRPGGG